METTNDAQQLRVGAEVNIVLTPNQIPVALKPDTSAYLVPILKLSIPIRRVPCDIIFLDRAWFPKLRGGRSVQVETDHPDARPIEHLALLAFRLWLCRRDLM